MKTMKKKKKDCKKHIKNNLKLLRKSKRCEKRITSNESEEFEYLSFDLENRLPIPRILTSIVFYKQQ